MSGGNDLNHLKLAGALKSDKEIDIRKGISIEKNMKITDGGVTKDFDII
jgi:hypothetical protein